METLLAIGLGALLVYLAIRNSGRSQGSSRDRGGFATRNGGWQPGDPPGTTGGNELHARNVAYQEGVRKETGKE